MVISSAETEEETGGRVDIEHLTQKLFQTDRVERGIWIVLLDSRLTVP